MEDQDYNFLSSPNQVFVQDFDLNLLNTPKDKIGSNSDMKNYSNYSNSIHDDESSSFQNIPNLLDPHGEIMTYDVDNDDDFDSMLSEYDEIQSHNQYSEMQPEKQSTISNSNKISWNFSTESTWKFDFTIRDDDSQDLIMDVNDDADDSDETSDMDDSEYDDGDAFGSDMSSGNESSEEDFDFDYDQKQSEEPSSNHLTVEVERMMKYFSITGWEESNDSKMEEEALGVSSKELIEVLYQSIGEPIDDGDEEEEEYMVVCF